MAESKWTFRRILKHCLFWVVYILLNTVVYGHFHENDYRMVLIADLKVLPLKLAIAYLTIYYSIPRYILKRKKYLSFFVSFFFYSTTIILLSNYFMYQYSPIYKFYDHYLILKHMLNAYPVIGLVVAIKFWKYWYQSQLFQERLQKEKFESELKMLKSQIHPHFLFNTINNIYSLALEKSEKTPGSLLKLSEILDYVLYKCNADTVPLEKEIELLKNYFSLEKLRYEDRLDVMINIAGNLEGVHIAPLILLAFAENSFKHGVAKMPDDAWVSFDILVENNVVAIKFENSKNDESTLHPDHRHGTGEYDTVNGGIGLKNVRKRLDLIYANRYSLEILADKNSFLVLLKIDLRSVENRVDGYNHG